MLELFDKIDKQLFLFFNGMHSELSDTFWYVTTNIPTWIPLYVLLLFFLIKEFKADSIYLIVGVLLVVLFCDQFTSSFMKPFFQRLRPCHDPEIGPLVHVIKNCGGQFGFASGHSANSFGIAMFAWLVFRSYWKWTAIIFVWAFLVAFSRIMVGVHYPADIITGALIGLLFSWLTFKIIEEFYFRIKLEPIIKN